MRGYVIDVAGPGVRWGEFYPVQPDILADIKKHIEKLATLCGGRFVSGEYCKGVGLGDWDGRIDVRQKRPGLNPDFWPAYDRQKKHSSR